MIATILFTIVAQQQQSNLYQRVIKQPTGENGYEENVAAADVLMNGDVGRSLDYIDSDHRDGTRLDAQRALARNMGRIVQLIKQGNSKEVSYPRQMDFNTLLPELSVFRFISRALVHTAEARLADGRPNEAMEILTQTVVFGDKISGAGPIIHNLVGRMIASQALQSVGKNVQYISSPSSHSIVSVCNMLLEQESPFVRSLQWEYSGIANSLDDFLKDPLAILGSETEIRFVALLQNASENEIADAKREIDFTLRQRFQARIMLLQSPEREWVNGSRQIDELATPTGPLAKAVFEYLIPRLGRVDLYAIGRRTLLRLFRATAAVMDFKWNHGYYPSSLLLLTDLEVVYDPLTGEPFEYERTDASFRLYSNGTEDTGRIDLFYSPPRSGTINPG